MSPSVDDMFGDGLDADCSGADGMDADGDTVPDADFGGSDCDDDDPEIRPGVPDAAGDRVDQNCDGEDGVDADGDGWTSPDSGGDDCDDSDDAVHPEADDAAGDELDSDCDGIDGVDADGDTFASVESGGPDCDDADPGLRPGSPDEVGDAVDQNCDGADGVDADGDGAATPASGGDDCDDDDAARFPAAADAVGDVLDTNCDGIDGVDADGDDVPSAASGGTDCDDVNPQAYPGARDGVGDLVDQDCDGADGVDDDGDSFASVASGGDDCNDADPAIRPYAQGDWLWEPLSTRLRGDPPDAGLDSNGDVRVAFIEADDFGINQMVLASNASGAWRYETVGPSRHCVAMALDANDAVHLVYRNAGEVPQYATNATGAWVFEPIGGISAIANCTIEVAPNGQVHTIFSTDALAVTHGYRSPDDWLFEEVATGEVVTTDVSFAIDAANVLHVAYSDNSGVHYVSNASPGYAETNEAGAGAGGAEPFALVAGDTLIVAVDGGAPRTVTFDAGEFANIGAATAEEVAAVINAELAGVLATAVLNGTRVRITSDAFGTSSVIDIGAGSTAIDGAKLDLSSGASGSHAGGTWVREEVDTGQTAFLALNGNVPAILYQGQPRMFYAERTGPVGSEWVLTELPWDSLSPHLTFASDGYRHGVFGDVGTGNVVWARSSGGGGWASEPVQPVEGLQPLGRVLLGPADEPMFFVAQDDSAEGGEVSLFFVQQGPVDGIDQDCDGRVR